MSGSDKESTIVVESARKSAPSTDEESDGVIAQSCYDMTAVIGLVRAAERAKSPAILQLFPITLKYGGGPFLQFCLDM